MVKTDAKIASGLDDTAVQEIERELRHLLADTFALYIKTKNFHWHMKARHFRDHHLLLDEQASELFGITDVNFPLSGSSSGLVQNGI